MIARTHIITIMVAGEPQNEPKAEAFAQPWKEWFQAVDSSPTKKKRSVWSRPVMAGGLTKPAGPFQRFETQPQDESQPHWDSSIEPKT